ncbi:MAG: class I SAM-dependent methyltransferase [Actinobacteria bacterium]|nr:MAG: class I SAM-dependent methyltransferase [Actinomycetota bacterium]
MLESAARLIGERVGADGLVLDVGGGARPFPRADWVIDILPYEARGTLGWDGDPRGERFRPSSWVCRDICDRQPWPFADRQFDFAVCSHTLEDVRDPVWVGSELQRVAAEGYIEVPSLREELTYGIHGPWVGWSHHRWLVIVEERSIEFLFKHHVVNRRGSHLPAGSAAGLTPEQRVQTLWWEGHFDVREWLASSAQELDGFLEHFVAGTEHSSHRGLRHWIHRR